mgnify:CR=1 FL=1
MTARPYTIILDITEHEHEVAALAGPERHLHIMRRHGRPTVSHGVAGLTGNHRLRLVEAVVEAEEGLAVGVKAVNRNVYVVEGVMIAALLVLGLQGF